MTATLAGRRVDAAGAETPQFPPENAERIKAAIRDELARVQAKELICSGACGTDLLGLEAAAELGIETRIVLPFERETFRQTSVIDRGEEWGSRYDRALERGRVVELGLAENDPEVYLQANSAILREAMRDGDEVTAIVVWNGRSRGPDDVTAAFLTEARFYALPCVEISTIG